MNEKDINRREFLKKIIGAGLILEEILFSGIKEVFADDSKAAKLYDIQYGAFEDKDNAYARIDDIRKIFSNMSGYISPDELKTVLMEIEGRMVYKVYRKVGKNKNDIEDIIRKETPWIKKKEQKMGDIGPIPQLKTTYDILVGSWKNPFSAQQLLEEIKGLGAKTNNPIYQNAHISNIEINSKDNEKEQWYRLILPTRAKTIDGLTETIKKLDNEQVMIEHGIRSAYIPSEVDYNININKTVYASQKIDRSARDKANKKLKGLVDEIHKSSQLQKYSKKFKELFDPMIDYICKKYENTSGKKLLKEKAAEYVSHVSKWSKQYKVPFFDLMSILVYEARFVNKTGDTKNYLNGIYNPSESFIQMGRITQMHVYNKMLRDKEYITPTRDIKGEWKQIYTYFKDNNILKSNIIPDIRYNPDTAIRFAAKYFQMCIEAAKGNIDIAIQKYNAGLGGLNPEYFNKVNEVRQELKNLG